jgi:hypothetical protein
MLKSRPGCIIAARTGPKPFDLTTTESARVSIIIHFRVMQLTNEMGIMKVLLTALMFNSFRKRMLEKLKF